MGVREQTPNLELSMRRTVSRLSFAGKITPGNDKIIQTSPGDEIWIPDNTRQHRSCGGTTDVRVLEVAQGDWQQEDIPPL